MVARARQLKRWQIAAILAIVLITVAAISYIVAFNDDEVVDLFPNGELRIGIDPSVPPFGFIDPYGAIRGLDADIGIRLASELDLPARLVTIGYDGLYDALKSNQVDMVVSTLITEPLLLGDVFYTQPYYNAGLVLVSNSANLIESMRDLPGTSLAYEFGSSADAEARLWTRRIPEFELRPYELPTYALDAVRLGDADAALVDSITARLYLHDHSQWDADFVQITDVGYVIAVHRNHVLQFLAVNKALGNLLKDNIVESLIIKWFS
jgi:ABC-type amino acid transport substrate-binding protein